MLDRMRLWLRAIMLRRRLEREMQEEIAQHLDRATRRLITRGHSVSEARRDALREFGNVTSLQEQGRIARGGRWIDALAADSRFALRHFARYPVATLAMFLVLAGGMSISTSLFSFLHAYSVQPPLGVEARDDIVRIRGSQLAPEGLGVRRFTRAELEEYQKLTSHFSAVAGWANAPVTVDIGADADRRSHAIAATFVTEDYFAVLGIRPVLGTSLPRAGSNDAGDPLVTVISYGAWEQLFLRSPGAIGATLIVNGLPVTVVGVAPPRFTGLNVYSTLKIWLPLRARPLLLPPSPADAELFGATARLRPGVTPDAATAAARVVAARVAASVSPPPGQQPPRGASTDVVPLLATNGDPMSTREGRVLAAVFAALGLLVLLVTCTNVSALQTGLAMNRRREIAIRLSMGAGRARIIRQLLTESLILSTAAAGAAMGIVWTINRVLMTRVPDMPLEIAMSAAAALFTCGIAVAVGIAFGLSPALHATRFTVATALKDSTSSIAAPRVRLQRGLVIAQIAFTQPLIVGLAVMLLVLSSEYQRLGLNPFAKQILSLRIRSDSETAVAPRDSARVQQQARAALQRLRDRLAATPGVAGVVQDPRHSLALDSYRVHPDDRVAGGLEGSLSLVAPMVAPGYFDVLDIPLVLGRDFTAADIGAAEGNSGGTPVIIGAHLARLLWPGASPLGRRLQPAPDASTPGRIFSIVGVVDQPEDALRDPGDGYRAYLPPDATRAAMSLALLVRAAGEAQPLIPTIRTMVREELPGMMLAELRSLADVEGEVRRTFALAAALLGGSGLVTLLLSAIGLYAVVAFAVGQRTAEIAVRMAVGAQARQITGRFLGEGLRLGAIGLLIGLPLSLVVLRMLLTADVLPRVPFAPVAGVAALGVLAVALGGTWIPARRAASVDPALVLRRE